MSEETNRVPAEDLAPDAPETGKPETPEVPVEAAQTPETTEAPVEAAQTHVEPLEASAQAPETPPESAEKPGLSARKRTALLRYMAVLFGVAFLLVLLSFLIQIRDSRETISDLNQSQSSALQRAQQLQTQNESLTEDNNNLRAQLSAAEAEAQDQADRIAALEELLSEAEDGSAESYALYDQELHKRLSYELLFAAADCYAQGQWQDCLDILEGELSLENLDDYPAARAFYDRLLDGCRTELANDDAQ